MRYMLVRHYYVSVMIMDTIKFLITFLLMVLPCTTNGKALSENDKNIDKLAEAINEFAFNFHRLTTTDSRTVFSPFSLSTVLSMLYHGSNGTTAEELSKGLCFESVGLHNDASIQSSYKSLLASLTKSDSKTVLAVANAIVSEKTFDIKPAYKKFAQDVYNAEIKEADFKQSAEKVTKDINDWVKNATHNKIEKLLEQTLSPSTVLVLLNAVHFKGAWNKQFNAQLTAQEVFYNRGLGAGATTVDMMHHRGVFRYVDDADVTDTEVLEIPYEGKTFSMWILLTRGIQGGLEYVEKELTANNIQRLRANMRDFVVDLSLPKFKIDYGGDVSNSLNQMGMTTMFRNANLEGISDGKNFKVSSVVHKAMIEVDENGTEAAASSAVNMVTFSATSIDEREHTSFIVNHPFLYLIMDNRSGTVLFMGRVDEM